MTLAGSHLMVRSTLSALRARNALNTVNTPKTFVSKFPTFWTISGTRKSTKLATMITKSVLLSRNEHYTHFYTSRLVLSFSDITQCQWAASHALLDIKDVPTKFEVP